VVSSLSFMLVSEDCKAKRKTSVNVRWGTFYANDEGFSGSSLVFWMVVVRPLELALRIVYVTKLKSVSNLTSNTIDKSKYHIPQRLILFKLIG